MIMERMNETDKTEYDTGAQDKAVGAQGQIARSQGGKARRIGIMGGTFNPIHNGHLIIAEDIREKTGLDKVLFIPSGQPPHKPGYEVADAEHRFEMVRRAVCSNRHFEASRIEIDRDGPTYTINTLQELRESYGEETAIYFIIGADVVYELDTWREYETVFRLCDFIAVMRPGFDESEFSGMIRRLSAEKGARIHPVPSCLVDISSTDIRERCSTGRSIKYLVPEPVEEYIIGKGLYRGNT
jgi:nicotinate-nucleotide adenylyltransferase